MSVRAVTPRLPALHGHTYVHAHDCAADCCNYDTFTDALATGEDIYDPEEWPHRPLRLGRKTKFVEGANAGRANGSVASRVMPAAPRRVGPDSRGRGSTTQESTS